MDASPATSLRRHAGASCRHALDWLFPASCALCAAPGPALCRPCRDEAVGGVATGCRRCAVPLHAGADGRLCGRCLRRPPRFDGTVAAALYAPPFDQLVRSLKYGAALSHAPLFAAMIAERFVAMQGSIGELPHVLLPVPLSRQRMASRGFNQSIEIARLLSRRSGIAVDTSSVLRVHDTAPQAALPLAARRRNVRGAFAVIDARVPALRGRVVGVVDDVMTTGATLDELARVLKAAGAKAVVNLVVARTP